MENPPTRGSTCDASRSVFPRDDALFLQCRKKIWKWKSPSLCDGGNALASAVAIQRTPQWSTLHIIGRTRGAQRALLKSVTCSWEMNISSSVIGQQNVLVHAIVCHHLLNIRPGEAAMAQFILVPVIWLCSGLPETQAVKQSQAASVVLSDLGP